MRSFKALLLVGAAGVLLLASSTAARAGTILLDSGGGKAQVNFFEPIGQSFTAEDPFVKAALSFSEINSGAPNESIQYDFYAGSGVGGTLLATTTFSRPVGFEGFFDFDLSSIPLLIGNVYSLVARIPGTSPLWAVNYTLANYAGGDPIGKGIVNLPDILSDGFFTDIALRVTPVTDPGAAVPEPASMVLIGTGLATLVARRRNKRS